MAKVNIALVGAGLWARDQHLPAILENQSVCLKAIYSRSQKSARGLAAQAPSSVQIFYDEPSSENSLDVLLSRSDITAVVVCVPILVQLDIVKKCLLAGKHVQSEKPIAGDVDSASTFIKWFRDAKASGEVEKHLVWAVAEEFRLMPSFNFMRDEVARMGAVQGFYARGHLYMPQDSPFYETAWRKVPGNQGGFILDGGVHWTAGLRHVLGEANRPIEVIAFTTLLKEYLAPVDTLHAVVKTETGISGTFAYSAAMQWKHGNVMSIEVVCAEGDVLFRNGDGIGIVEVVESGKEKVTKEFDASLNSRYELGTFVKSIETGTEEVDEKPEGALYDLEFMQRMLESGAEGGVLKKVAIPATSSGHLNGYRT